VHWEKGKIRKIKKALNDDGDLLRQVLEDAGVPEPVKGKSSHFVYILRLKGELNAVYVGMTGLHPYARYLNHVRGYKSSSHAKKRATALISYEGPMTQDAAKKREPALADELRDQGYVVYGGH
jgi:predicted GIY-YIG superfamily endonuclease